MNQFPNINLCIMQPGGYIHSLGFLDQARYFRHQFRRMGARVSMSKNRLRHNAANFVFGAHLGFEATLRQRYDCIFVNLEQLGEGGARVTPEYLRLLSTSAVVDCDESNIAAYCSRPDEVPVVPQLFAPYLTPVQTIPLEERPIDLLFIGSMNERRKIILDRLQKIGVNVAQFDNPLYGPERDDFIMQSKAVFNAHFYTTSRFEQTRVSHCMSLGTPVISEASSLSKSCSAFEDNVFWVNEETLEHFFTQQFNQPEFFKQAQVKLQRFAQHDPIEAYADLIGFATGYVNTRREHRDVNEPWRPTRVNLGSGRDYKLGWLNLDVLASAQPDLAVDLGRTIEWPLNLQSEFAGPVHLAENSLDLIYANNVLEHVGDLPKLMTNCLALLKTGGEMFIEVPYEHAATAWQDPTHLRALNENSWIYYTDWFWHLGWFEHRFNVCHSSYLDAAMKDCSRENAAFMRVVMTKVITTPRERMTARVMRPDFALEDTDEFVFNSSDEQQLPVEESVPCVND